jgi:hypothetical protein
MERKFEMSVDQNYLLGQASGINHFFEHVDHVVKLAMDVAYDYAGFLCFEQVGFGSYIG